MAPPEAGRGSMGGSGTLERAAGATLLTVLGEVVAFSKVHGSFGVMMDITGGDGGVVGG